MFMATITSAYFFRMVHGINAARLQCNPEYLKEFTIASVSHSQNIFWSLANIFFPFRKIIVTELSLLMWNSFVCAHFDRPSSEFCTLW
jgi:hypothetical protein